MKIIIIVLNLLYLSMCTSGYNDKDLLGNDVRLFQNTPVWNIAKAIEKDDTSLIKEILKDENQKYINFCETTYGQSLLYWSVYTDHYAPSKVLLELGANPNLKSKDSTTAIIQAANKFNSDFLKLLLKYGGDVNTVADIDTPQHLRTPLMAASFKSLESVKLLVESGANINFEYSKHGIQNALIYAFDGNKIEIVKYLVVDRKATFTKPLASTIEGDSLYITDFLRDMAYPLASNEYKIKMEIVNYLKDNGMDYFKATIPRKFYKIYDSEYLKKY